VSVEYKIVNALMGQTQSVSIVWIF